ncbi:uncharacterized protein PV09_00562 [Verruconis gallopava]|uniref:Uncharacterized protein n=1 Tax=Verruconis gallopava TaxID=253628 RepID=A0A0D2APJ6_9PEZI|nr:uncharacterized protein PV09_00562 [Verruconis gallopava]KIW08603.1 hypothetical protein PV09_00562 [Verruconis gallopava]
MLMQRLPRPSIGIASWCLRGQRARTLSTLASNPHIYYFPDPHDATQNLLSLLPTSPSTSTLVLGRTSTIPPESNPSSFTPNPRFLEILQSVMREYSIHDPVVQASAAAYASQAGATLSGGVLLPSSHPLKQRMRKPSTSGAGPTASQGGMGSGGRHGWVHVYDLRHPPDFGRIPDPEDIFGSVEVDGEGSFVGDGGNYQASGTYRIVTRDGVLGLSDFLRGKLVDRLKQLEREERSK